MLLRSSVPPTVRLCKYFTAILVSMGHARLVQVTGIGVKHIFPKAENWLPLLDEADKLAGQTRIAGRVSQRRTDSETNRDKLWRSIRRVPRTLYLSRASCLLSITPTTLISSPTRRPWKAHDHAQRTCLVSPATPLLLTDTSAHADEPRQTDQGAQPMPHIIYPVVPGSPCRPGLRR